MAGMASESVSCGPGARARRWCAAARRGARLAPARRAGIVALVVILSFALTACYEMGALSLLRSRAFGAEAVYASAGNGND